MTTATPEKDVRAELASVLGILSQSQQGQDVILSALNNMAADESPVFKVTPEAQSRRAASAAAIVAASHHARAKLRAEGPAGARVGVFLLELARETALTFEGAFKVVTALEVVGLARLEGSSTLVSEELDPPQADDPCSLIRAIYDQEPPPAAQAASPTLSDQ